jgi:hypothetical protein
MKLLSLLLLLFISFMLVFNGSVMAMTQSDLNSVLNNTQFYDPTVQPCTSQTSGTAVTSSLSRGSSVYILGDSITERAATAYRSAFQALGITANIDAEAGRSLNGPGIDGLQTTGMQAISMDKSEISKASAIVIGLGTNGGDTLKSINKAIKAIKQDNNSAPIYWIDTIVINRPDYIQTISQANQAIFGQANIQNYQVINWFKTVDPNGDPLNLTGKETDTNGYIDPNPASGLGVHPSIPKGIGALVHLVVSSVTGSNTTSLVCCGNSLVSLTGSGNADQAFNFFVQNGLTAIQSAGIVGNMMYESGDVNPQRVESDGNSQSPTGAGWGIVQFTPPSKVFAIASAANISSPVYELATQLELVWDQLTGKAGSFNNTQALSDLKAATTVQAATAAFQNDYERPASNASLQDRIAYAQQLLNSGQSTTSSSSTTLTSSSSCNPNSSTGGYENPFRAVSNLTPQRIDMGVDYDGNGPVYALGNGVVNTIFPNWYKDEPLIAYTLSGGAAAGKTVYLAECITPQVNKGEQVTSSTVIATMNDTSCFNGIETGWANLSDSHLTMAGSCFSNSATAYGQNFSQLLVSLGAKGGVMDPPLTCTLASGWPTW